VWSKVGLGFEGVRVATALDLDPGGQVAQLVELGLGEGDIGGREVLLQAMKRIRSMVVVIDAWPVGCGG
jgi:hypothetical protein